MTAMRLLRGIGPLAVAAAMAAAAIRPPNWSASDPAMVAVLLDTSASVPPEERTAVASWLVRSLEALPASTPIGVLTFDEAPRLAGIARADRAADLLSMGASQPPVDRLTDLGAAIREGAALVAGSGGGDLVVATDGADVVGDAPAAARAAARAGVRVHVLPLGGPYGAEVALESLDAAAAPGAQAITEATVIVRSTREQTVNVVAEAGGAAVAAASARAIAGAASAVTLLVPPPRPDRLVVSVTADADRDPSNNVARAFPGSSRGARTAALRVDPPAGFDAARWDRLPHPDVLAAYDAILLSADRRLAADAEEQENLARFARSGRSVLVAMGDAEAAAGMRGGPLESILPVRLEPPRPDGDSAAVVLLLDRSGSMGEPSSGASPLRLAIEAAQGFGSLLSSEDRFGVIAFDVAPHVLRAPGPGGDVSLDAAAWDGIVKAAGGTDWTSSLELALQWLSEDRAPRRHVILVSDGRLAPGVAAGPPPSWPEGITLSTVSMGANADQPTLARLSSGLGGGHDHVARPEDLPAALRREGARVRPLPSRREADTATPAPAYAAVLPSVRARSGSIQVAPRDEAEVAMSTPGGDPFLVFGKAGWGGAAFLAADPRDLAGEGGEGAGAVARLLNAALARVPMDNDNDSFTVRASRGRAIVEILPRGAPSLPRARALTPSGREVELHPAAVAPGRLRARFFTAEAGEYVVEVGGERTRFFVPTSAERAFLVDDPEWAARLARAGGGTVLGAGEPALPSPGSRPRPADAAPPLIAAAALVIFADALAGLRRKRGTPPWGGEGM